MKAELAPSRETFTKGLAAFVTDDPRDAMYRVSERLVASDWGKPAQMAEDVGVLLLTWNNAFYRYGGFDYDQLEAVIERFKEVLTGLRGRSLSTMSGADESLIKSIFDEFVEATGISYGKAKGRRSPVGAAKALHMLCPNFFPLWDQYIADAYGCDYSKHPGRTYVAFCRMMKGMMEHVGKFDPPVDLSDGRTLLKRIDEYNYGRFTLGP